MLAILRGATSTSTWQYGYQIAKTQNMHDKTFLSTVSPALHMLPLQLLYWTAVGEAFTTGACVGQQSEPKGPTPGREVDVILTA